MSMLRSLLFVLLLLTAVSLPACSVYKSEFKCDTPGACRSLQQVYSDSTSIPTLPPPPDPTRYAPPSSEPWTPPVKTVWIAPYVDSAGRRHEASLMRLIVLPGPKAATPEPEFLVPPFPDPQGDDASGPLAPPEPSPSQARQPRRDPSPSSRHPHPQPARPQGTTSQFTPPTNPPAAAGPPKGFGLPGY